MKIFATSMNRYNGGIAMKRRWGSSTVTRFMVGIDGSEPSTWEIIEGFGATPGDRKTYAITQFKNKHGLV